MRGLLLSVFIHTISGQIRGFWAEEASIYPALMSKRSGFFLVRVTLRVETPGCDVFQ